jgi:hypothetical protein
MIHHSEKLSTYRCNVNNCTVQYVIMDNTNKIITNITIIALVMASHYLH